MAKPEEVLLIEDENGSIVRETTCDTNSVALYNKEKERCFIILTEVTAINILNQSS